MKKKIIVSMIIFALGYSCCYAITFKKQLFLNELVSSWNGFEKEYREDIKNIDNLRYDLEITKNELDMWEKFSFAMVEESRAFEMERNEYYTMLIEHGIK